MSTRANIRVVSGNEETKLYRHRDGRPSDLGKAIKRYLKRLKYWNMEKITDKLFGGLRYWDRKNLYHLIESTTELHGDEDYVYVIDVDKRSLKCYRHYYDEPYERCCVPERECIIP